MAERKKIDGNHSHSRSRSVSSDDDNNNNTEDDNDEDNFDPNHQSRGSASRKAAPTTTRGGSKSSTANAISSSSSSSSRRMSSTSSRRREEEEPPPPPEDKRSATTRITAAATASSSSATAPSTNPPLPSSSRRSRTKRSSEEDDATVGSKQSQSTKGSIVSLSKTTKAHIHHNSSDESEDGKLGTARSSPSRRSRKDKQPPPLTTRLAEAAEKHKYSSGPFASEPFGAFHDAAFDDTNNNNYAFSNNTTTTTTNGGTAAAAAAAFSTSADFEAFADSDFGATRTTTASAFDAGFDAFGAPPDFPTQQQRQAEPIWDKTPHTNVPSSNSRGLYLHHKSIMTKNFHGSPINNPASGNILFLSTTTNGLYLHEVDPSRSYVQVASAPVLSADLRSRILTKYNATVTGVGTVWNLAAGTNGPTKEQVAVVIDLKIVEAATPMRVVIGWQLSNDAFHLDFVTTPPSGADFACDVSNFQSADGLLFIAGYSPKGACIFISKPAAREAWSANFLTGSGSVAVMSVTPTKPYLVIGLADGTVTVWTYASALIRSAATTKILKRWLFPLCRLDCETSLAKETPVNAGIDTDDSHSDNRNTSVKLGYQVIPEPTQSTVVSATPILSPVVAKRWIGKHSYSSVSWLQYGPHTDPLVAVVLQDAEAPVAKVLLCAFHFPMHSPRHLSKSESPLLSCCVVASTTVAKDSTMYPSGLLQNHRFLVLFSKERISSMSLSSDSTEPSALGNLGQTVTSALPGLSSSGDPYLTDSETDKDGILYIFSRISCERTSHVGETSMQGWSPPARRMFLCRVLTGDTKETCIEERKEQEGFGDRDDVSGGAVSDVICELHMETLAHLSPVRIVRCLGGNMCAVLFRTSLGSKANVTEVMSLDINTIALVDFESNEPIIHVVQGRDIAFFTSDSAKEVKGLLLSQDGSSLTRFHWKASGVFDLTTSFRPILGVDNNKDYVHTERIKLYTEDSKLSLIVLGRRLRDSQYCFVAGDICDTEDSFSTDWSKLLPNLISGRSAWLHSGENVFDFVGLQGDGSGYRNFALSTSSRVLILSSALIVVAEANRCTATSTLAPIGSFAVCFSTDYNVRYICCMDKGLSSGTIVSLPQTRFRSECNILIAIRPDRMLFCPCQSVVSLAEFGQSHEKFCLQTAVTRPVMLLEPMVANAICTNGKQNTYNPVLRVVVEKFGRKVTSTSHGENEGIGPYGAGITSSTFELLSKYGLSSATSWLITGTPRFERASNSTILPLWLPIGPKSACTQSSDAMLHVISQGDSYFSEYVKSPNQSSISTLPRQSDPIAFLCREHAQSAIQRGKTFDALKTLDIAGNESTENLALQLSLLLEKSKRPQASGIFKSLSGLSASDKSLPSASMKSSSSLAALALAIEKNSREPSKKIEIDENLINGWMRNLAPSLQRSKTFSRTRQRIFSDSDVKDSMEAKVAEDKLWTTPCNESKHVWNEGPRKERENLLILDSIEDWLGRRRPLIFGKDGIQAGRERGETTLADILNRDDDSFGVTEKENDAEKSQTDNWVDGIGEGRSDESNLSAYYRMSEGEDDETSWRLDGLVDLSPHQNIAVILGNAQSVSLRPTTSSVDEGEPGKVKSLYDIVFSSDRNEASCLSIPSYRGGSLDVGVLHTVNNENRKKASYEFWFFLPSQGFLSDIVLIRRTMGSSADNIESMDSAFKTTNAIWELVLQPSGLLEFRTCGGSTFLSSQRDSKRSSSETDQENEKPFLAATDRWNHVCLVLNSKGLDVSDCIVTLFMKGIEVASMKTSMLPPNMSRKDVEKDIQHAGIVDKSLLLYGLHHNSGFRLTEIRVWACERSAADTQTFLFEYLIAAEQKKKFKVKIANKNKKGPALGKGLGLAPPKGIPVATNKGVALPGPSQREPSMGVSLVPPPKEEHSFSLKPAKQQAAMTFAPSIVDEKISQKQDVLSGSETSHIYPDSSQLASPKDFPEKRQLFESSLLSPATDNHQLEDPVENFEDSSQNVAATLWDTAVPLSQQLRPSAAAALIRGPPATRHYGGNRGGLPDYSGVERFGVGGIAVCGSEKTIVFRDNEDPPALTYPIGASGAVISDHMDDEGSEFLCCFLAKEGRMVVFELRSRTVVVELQMTTKLNFWRYLPPEAAGNTLCFMLVTPVGGFHWKPLEESPRPHQVWKRGSDLQGKKVVGYEEGGSNGLDGADICSRVGLITVTRSSGGSSLEGWLLPISGSSKAHLVSDDLLGACLCQPLIEDDGPFLPFLVTVNSIDDDLLVNAFDITEKVAGSLSVGEVHASQTIDESEIGQIIFEPPALAMGPLPEALCVSLANIIVVVLRRKGLVAAFELEDGEINTIAMESVDHFVIDAVMRYSSDFGGAEIVMLLSDETNPKDGRIVSFCFRSAA